MKRMIYWLSILFVLAMFSSFASAEVLLISVGGKSDGPNSGGSFGVVRDNNAGLFDGKRDCACVNNGSFGPGWNPGEKVVVRFNNYVNINSIALYLGCSQQHSEVASGIVRYANQSGGLVPISDFSNVGYINNNARIYFSHDVFTQMLEIEMTSGGGADRNICFSELDIYGHN